MKTGIHLIHWYFKSRRDLLLNRSETFHIKMLLSLNTMKMFDEIHINVAIDDVDDTKVKAFVNDVIHYYFPNESDKISIKFIQNNKEFGEYYTWKNIFEYALSGKQSYLFYSHFKGTKPYDYNVMCNVLYWSYLMYTGCVGDNFNNVKSILDEGNFTYGFAMKHYIAKGVVKNYMDAFDELKRINAFTSLYKYMAPHTYTGNYCWYNLPCIADFLTNHNVTLEDFNRMELDDNISKFYIVERLNNCLYPVVKCKFMCLYPKFSTYESYNIDFLNKKHEFDNILGEL